jgi:hypothetical protein
MKHIIKVKTVYQGQIAFPEKFYQVGAVVKVGNEKMKLTDKMKPTGYSEYFDDKFGRGKYRLIYFNWIADKLTKKEQAYKDYNSMTEKEQFEFRNRN